MSFKNTFLPVQTTIQSGGRLLNLEKPVVMGILNATPDSFYNKGRNSSTEDILRMAEKMLNDGATILDIGGASTRPGAELIAAAEEISRVVPAIEAIMRHFPEAWLSVDTYNAATAEAAVVAGASIINDVSSGALDDTMLETVARLKVPYIAMHMRGVPKTMQQDPQYHHVVNEVQEYLCKVCEHCATLGITDVIIDPGFGFGKTLEHNFSLLNELGTLRVLGKPVLAGISRKGMVWKTLCTNAEEALNGTTALHMAALQQGAAILRAHDVREAVEVVKLWGMIG